MFETIQEMRLSNDVYYIDHSAPAAVEVDPIKGSRRTMKAKDLFSDFKEELDDVVLFVLDAGDYVKLCFRLDGPLAKGLKAGSKQPSCMGECMYVKVTAIDEESGDIHGILVNHPIILAPVLSMGTKICFPNKAIAEVIRPKDPKESEFTGMRGYTLETPYESVEIPEIPAGLNDEDLRNALYDRYADLRLQCELVGCEGEMHVDDVHSLILTGCPNLQEMSVESICNCIEEVESDLQSLGCRLGDTISFVLFDSLNEK